MTYLVAARCNGVAQLLYSDIILVMVAVSGRVVVDSRCRELVSC